MSQTMKSAAFGADADSAMIEQIKTLPEPEALLAYAAMSSRLQWLTRQRTSGPRRAALIEHHAFAIANCR